MNNLLKILFISTLIFHSVTYAEESCGTVDLNVDKASPFNRIPVYDQDGVGLCYSYAAAQMIDFYRIKNGDNSYDRTNPVYASWATYYENKTFFKEKSLNDGGQSSDVIKALKETGVCSNQDSQALLASLSKSTNLSAPQTLYFLEMMYKHYHGFFAEKNWSKTQKDLENFTPLTCNQSMALKLQFEKNGTFGIAPTLVLNNLFKQCKKTKLNVPDLEDFSYGADKKMQKILDSNLAKNFPVQIDMCSKLFSKGAGYRGLNDYSPPLSRYSNGNMRSDCAPHAVLITGKTKIGGECNYLIRNSWGSYWYPPTATSCACKTRDGSYKANCKKGEGVEYVGCWFKEKDLLPNIGSVNVFK